MPSKNFALKDFAIERTKDDHGSCAFLEDYDFFPYDSPLRSTASNWSGGISLGVACVMIWTLITALMSISSTQYTYSSAVEAAESLNETPLPELYIVMKDSNGDYFYDDSYYTWTAKFTTIYESDTNPSKPRSVVYLDVKPCDILIDEDRAPIKALCLVKPSDIELVVHGRYENNVYEYVDMALNPCLEPDTTPAVDKKCANSTLVNKAFFTDSLSFSIWTYGYRTAFEKGWDSILYRNTEGRWQGAEVYFERQAAERRNIFGMIDYINNWMKFDGYTIRNKPLVTEADGTIDGGDIVKIYYRARDTEVVETIVQYGFINLIEQIGGMWSILTLIFGSLAVYWNKLRYDRNMNDISKFSEKKIHDIYSGEKKGSTATNDNTSNVRNSTVENTPNPMLGFVEMKNKSVSSSTMKTRRFSTLPLSKQDVSEVEAKMNDENAGIHIDRSSLIFNSSGTAKNKPSELVVQQNRSDGQQIFKDKREASSSSNSSPAAPITVFQIKDVQSIFSAGAEAPKIQVHLLQAALSKILRSYRMLPLSENEIYSALEPYIDFNREKKWSDIITGWDKLVTFPTYHDLVVRLNDIIKVRFTKRGRLLMRTISASSNFGSSDASDGDNARYCGIETAQTATDSKSISSIGCITTKHTMPPPGQEIYAECDIDKKVWYFRDDQGLYLSHNGLEQTSLSTEQTTKEANIKLKFCSNTRNTTEQFLLHFDHEEKSSGKVIISTATAHPYYIAISSDVGNDYLHLLPRQVDNKGDAIMGEANEAIFQLYLPYYDKALTRVELEAICASQSVG
jgi:hypothetical protein